MYQLACDPWLLNYQRLSTIRSRSEVLSTSDRLRRQKAFFTHPKCICDRCDQESPCMHGVVPTTPQVDPTTHHRATMTLSHLSTKSSSRSLQQQAPPQGPKHLLGTSRWIMRASKCCDALLQNLFATSRAVAMVSQPGLHLIHCRWPLPRVVDI